MKNYKQLSLRPAFSAWPLAVAMRHETGTEKAALAKMSCGWCSGPPVIFWRSMDGIFLQFIFKNTYLQR